MIDNTVMELISEHLDIQQINPTDTMRTLGADSLDGIELLMIFESNIDCYIPDAATDSIETVQDVIDIVKKGMKV